MEDIQIELVVRSKSVLYYIIDIFRVLIVMATMKFKL
jgi:hypothetical protein